MPIKKKKKKHPEGDEDEKVSVQNNAKDEEQKQNVPMKSKKGGADKEGSNSKGGGKGKKGQPKLSKGSDDPLAKEVVAMILKEIAEPESQKDGKAFVPSDWSTKFKPKLGPYKKFLQAHPDEFALVEDGTGNFIIKRPQDVDPNEQKKNPLIKGATWQKKLLDAWLAYCLVFPKNERDLNLFLAPLPRAAREGKLRDDTPAAPDNSGELNSKEKNDCVTDSLKRKHDEEAPPAKASKKKKKAKEPLPA